MKQLFLQKGIVKPLPVSKPQLHSHEILVQVYYSFVSTGTESATINESKKTLLQKSLTKTSEKIDKVFGAIKENGITGTVALIKGSLQKVSQLGYSCSGKIIAVGKNVTKFSPGDFVACAGANIANHAEYIAVPQNLAIKLQSQSNLKYASLATIGAIALQGIRRANLKLGEKVCVVGLGLLGQLTVQLAKLSGCKVYGIDIDDARCFLAQKLSCDHTYNPHSTNVSSDITFHTEHRGVDATIITAASQSGGIIQQAMEFTRRKGKVVLVGDVKLEFDRSPFYEKEIDFLISCSYGPGRYDKSYEQQGNDYPYAYVRWTENRNMQLFAQLVEERKINIKPLITQEIPFEHATQAYQKLLQEKQLGVILSYNPKETPKQDVVIENDQPTAYAKSTYKPYVNKQKTVNVVFIGAGGFAKVKLLPLISKIKATKIHTIIDLDQANAINTATQYHAEQFDNTYNKILNDQTIQAVIIATPHVLHTKQALSFLKAGKAVFVEKPAAVTNEQYNELRHFLENSKQYLYCVDFNRSFAPFILKIKKAIEKRTTPLIIHYRMNAGFLSKEHWIQSQKQGGRIIGEACHIFELFGFLTNAKPVKTSVTNINTTRDDLCKNDNFSVQITFDDGSICTLLYTALGNKEMNKERMEVFFDGKSIVMDDYKELYGYGLPRSFNQTTKYPDKGHKNLLTQFINAAKTNSQSPISQARILQATKLSIQINNLIQGKQ